MKQVRLLPAIQQALSDTGLPYELKASKRHQKIFLDGKFVGIVPLDGRGNESGRGHLNIITQIRRAARGQQVSR